MTQKLTRALIYGDTEDSFTTKIQAFEEEFNAGLVNYEGRAPVTIRDIPLKKLAVGYDDELVAAKVYDTVVRGAWEDENLWRRAANVIYMTSEIERVPAITPDAFEFKEWTRGAAVQEGGGSFWHVELDCSDDDGLYAADVPLSKSFVKRRGFDAVEQALACMGQAAGRLILQAIRTELLADVDSTMTDTMANYGNGHYKALVKMESLIATVGMSPNIALINPAEGYDVGISDYFIRESYYNAARGIPVDLHSIGSLFGRIPILRHRDITAASMIMGRSDAMAFVGIMEDITIEDYDDVRHGMLGSVVSLQFDVASGKDATGPTGATNPIAKSWAVTTSA